MASVLPPSSSASLHEERSIECQLCELFEREEITAQQRSRVDWLREGDRNTAFFQARASTRRHSNKISVLAPADGSMCEDPKEIKGMVQGFDENLFTTEVCDPIDAVLDHIPCKVDDSINTELCKPYSDEEIKASLFPNGPNKSARSGRFSRSILPDPLGFSEG